VKTAAAQAAAHLRRACHVLSRTALASTLRKAFREKRPSGKSRHSRRDHGSHGGE